MKNDVCFPILEFSSKKVTTMCGSDIGCEGGDSRYWLYGIQIDAYEGANEQPGRMMKGYGVIPTIKLLGGMYLLATCSQPPGAAQRSIVHLADSRKEYFLLS